MKKELIENNPLIKLSIEFSVAIVAYCDRLYENKKFVICNQLLKSGTSGANSMEAQNNESKADFILKMKIAAKEAEETQYWLIVCKSSNGYPDTTELENKLDVLQKIINAILTTAKRKI
jgi:four helix bundle protein